MKIPSLMGWSLALLLTATAAPAQETKNSTGSDSEKLARQLKEIQEKLERQQRELRESFEKQQRELRAAFEKVNREQQAEIQALKLQITGMSTNRPAAPPIEASPQTAAQLKELSEKVDSVVEAQTKARPNEFNPAIGLVGETLFSYRSQGSQDTGSSRSGGFDVFQRSVELNVAASVDPFAKGYVVANATADSVTGEATFGIEEAALQTTSLPWNLEVKAGRFFGEFGRLSYIHDHELPFVNRPLALDQYVGGESRTDGAQVNWLVPIPHFLSLTAGIGNGFGGDSPLKDPGTYRALSGLTYFGRLSSYFDVGSDWNIETGVSGLINPENTDRGGASVTQPNGDVFTLQDRRLAGADFKLNWVPLQNNQFHSFSWGTEVLYSDSRYSVHGGGPLGMLPTEDVGALGLYSYAVYKWHRQWSGGFLFDYVQDAANRSEQTLSYSPFITYALSHWNQLRLQYTHTTHNGPTGLKPDDAICLQWAWIIGAHSHGWQQR